MTGNTERYATISSTQVHDLKNRLTVIKGLSQLLCRQVQRADWEQGRIIERADQLQQEVVRLETMINALMQPSGAGRCAAAPEPPHVSDA